MPSRRRSLKIIEKKQEYQDNTERIEVERSFSLSKRCYGMGLFRMKLYDTTLTSIALSVFVTNLFKIQARILFALIGILGLNGHQYAEFEPKTDSLDDERTFAEWWVEDIRMMHSICNEFGIDFLAFFATQYVYGNIYVEWDRAFG